MKTRLKAVYKPLPFEEGKIYTTKFATKEKFELKKILWKEEKIKDEVFTVAYMFYGIYLEHPHLGLCSLNVDRLIPEEVYSHSVNTCPHCKNEIELKNG